MQIEIYGIKLECSFDYEPEEQGQRERGSGLQLEPDCPEQITLEAVEVKGVDVLELLDQK